MDLIIHPEIYGLSIVKNVFTEEEENEYIKKINSDEHGKICHQIHTAKEFGWKFLPVKEKTKDDYIEKFPEWLSEIWEKISKRVRVPISRNSLEKSDPDHVLINTYKIGDGCVAHVDDLNFWTGWVIGVSLGSNCIMELSKSGDIKEIFLPRRSVYVLTDDAKTKWSHGIPFRNDDTIFGDIIKRDIRYSITFRDINEKFLSDEVRCAIKKID